MNLKINKGNIRPELFQKQSFNIASLLIFVLILIFNVSRVVGITTKSYKQQLLEFKNKPDQNFCVILNICSRFKKFRYYFRKYLPFTPVQPSIYDQNLPSPYFMMMKLRSTQMMGEFFLKPTLGAFIK